MWKVVITNWNQNVQSCRPSVHICQRFSSVEGKGSCKTSAKYCPQGLCVCVYVCVCVSKFVFLLSVLLFEA